MSNTVGQLDANVDCMAFGTPAREVVTVTGPDARSFLQSLVSQDLDLVGPGLGARSLLLAPQGKLVAAFRIIERSGDEFWLDCDAGIGAALREGLQRFKIRVKADIVARDDLDVVSRRGSATNDVLDRNGVEIPGLERDQWSLHNNHVVIRAPWGEVDGVDLIGPINEPIELVGATTITLEASETLRIEQGIVRQGVDIDDSTIAQEAHLEASSVSFTKGCFVGQELVCRIDSRGHVNRFVRRLSFAGSDRHDVCVGGELFHNGKVVGTMTSVAPLANVALGVVRRELEPGDCVTMGSARLELGAIAT